MSVACFFCIVRVLFVFHMVRVFFVRTACFVSVVRCVFDLFCAVCVFFSCAASLMLLVRCVVFFFFAVRVCYCLCGACLLFVLCLLAVFCAVLVCCFFSWCVFVFFTRCMFVFLVFGGWFLLCDASNLRACPDFMFSHRHMLIDLCVWNLKSWHCRKPLELAHMFHSQRNTSAGI